MCVCECIYFSLPRYTSEAKINLQNFNKKIEEETCSSQSSFILDVLPTYLLTDNRKAIKREFKLASLMKLFLVFAPCGCLVATLYDPFFVGQYSSPEGGQMTTSSCGIVTV